MDVPPQSRPLHLQPFSHGVQGEDGAFRDDARDSASEKVRSAWGKGQVGVEGCASGFVGAEEDAHVRRYLEQRGNDAAVVPRNTFVAEDVLNGVSKGLIDLTVRNIRRERVLLRFLGLRSGFEGGRADK